MVSAKQVRLIQVLEVNLTKKWQALGNLRQMAVTWETQLQLQPALLSTEDERVTMAEF
jgi:hypothetical protein